jgi:hypothetical protein
MDFINKIEKTISDFDVFINFVESAKPHLSCKRGELGKKDSFKLNQMLYHRKDVDKPNFTQYQYPIIHFMFFLALHGDIYVKAYEKGRTVLIETPALKEFKTLNIYEKYIYLLQTYWTKYDFETRFRGTYFIDYFYKFFNILLKSKKPRWIIVESGFNIYYINSSDPDFFYKMNFFGFGDYKINHDEDVFPKNSIIDFFINDFGIYSSRFLIKDAISVWNNKYKEDFFRQKRRKNIFQNKKDPFDIFKDFFPGDKVKKTITYTDEFDRIGAYTFKVSLHSGLWRKIRISHYHYLYDLHMAIQEAFGFDNDHLYAFYIGGNRKTGKPIYCPEVEEQEGMNSVEATIEDLKLFKGQKLFYLFDFGDMWWFDIRLLSIDKELPMPSTPMIIDRQGESPDQYRD